MSTVNIDQVLYTRAKWRLRFLIPCWVVQVTILLCLMGIFAYRVAETVEHYDEANNNGQIPMVEIVWEATNVAFSTLALILTILEIAKTATEALTPFAMLCTHVLKLTLAFAMLGLDVTVNVQGTGTGSDKDYAIVGLALDCGFLAVAIATLLYSIKKFRLLLKYEEYHLTDNSQNPRSKLRDLELGKHSRNSLNLNAPTAYASKTRSIIGGSPRTSPRTSPTSPNLKHEIDRRIGAELGGGGVERSPSLVGSGVVPRLRASQNANEMRRSKSWITEIGVVGPHGEDDDDDDGSATVRGSGEHARERHGSIPTVIVSPTEERGEEDARGLLYGEGGRGHDGSGYGYDGRK